MSEEAALPGALPALRAKGDGGRANGIEGRKVLNAGCEP
jgi:hypothetical protein